MVSRWERLMYGLLGTGAVFSLIGELREPDWTTPTAAAIVFSAVWSLVFYSAMLAHMPKLLLRKCKMSQVETPLHSAHAIRRGPLAPVIRSVGRVPGARMFVERHSTVPPITNRGQRLLVRLIERAVKGVQRFTRPSVSEILFAGAKRNSLNFQFIHRGTDYRLVPQFTYNLCGYRYDWTNRGRLVKSIIIIRDML